MIKHFKILCIRKEGAHWPKQESFLKNGTGEVIFTDRTEAEKLAEEAKNYFKSPYLDYQVKEFTTSLRINLEV